MAMSFMLYYQLLIVKYASLKGNTSSKRSKGGPSRRVHIEFLLMFCLQQQNKQNLKELALVGTCFVNTVKYYVGITRPSKCDENKLPE